MFLQHVLILQFVNYQSTISITKQTDNMMQPYTTILTGSDIYSPMTRGWKHMGMGLLEVQN